MDKSFKDIALIPHFFNHKWASDLNSILSTIFYVPEKYFNFITNKYEFNELSYLPGKSQLHNYISEILPELRSKGIKKVFYCNLLDDFTSDIQNAGFVNKVGGILHATNHQDLAIGQNKRLINYENAIMNMSKQVIVASNFMKNKVPYDVDVLGLPVNMNIQEPSVSDNILFSHRLMKDKNINMLLELPKKLKDKITVTCPSGQTTYVGKVKKEFKNFYFKKPSEIYIKLLNQSGFGLSFASHDNFGYSLMEGIFSGLTYLVHDNDTTTYKEFVIDEFRFSTIDELISMYQYFCQNIDDRVRLVKKQQELVKKYKVDTWLENLKKNIKI